MDMTGMTGVALFLLIHSYFLFLINDTHIESAKTVKGI
jgi:hypothetical protein